MSSPNDPGYDPKQAALLAPAALDAALDAARAAFAAAGNVEALIEVRPTHLGDRAPIPLARREIASLPPQARSDAGKRVNEARTALAADYDRRLAELTALRDAQALTDERVDVTVPVRRRAPGARHPLTVIADRVADIFVAMGYSVAEGPEAEAEWLNFDALNIAPDHPAREMHDTLYLEPPEAGVLMRTHTSPVQIRTMLDRPPPIYIVCPGRTYRNEASDATHAAVFHQVEGLVVDEGITMAHLRGTLARFVTEMFGDGLRTRLRPNYFPFTEPSAEVDIECVVCRGESARGGEPCRTCSSEGWIEWGGCGMVNPRVLRSAGVDPHRYSGFAFGMGLERTLMFRHSIADIRDLSDGDVRVSRALGSVVQVRVPLSWLADFVDVSDVDPADLASALVRVGLEVEQVERVGHDVSG